MSRHRKARESILALREAAQWLERVNATESTTEDFADWQAWLEQSSTHREAFTLVEEIWSAAGALRPENWPSAGDVAADPYDGSVPVETWRSRDPARRSSRD